MTNRLAFSLFCAAFCLCPQPIEAQPTLRFTPQTGLRAGDLAPEWELANGAQTDVSTARLGQKPLVILLDGAAPSLSFAPSIIEAARSAAKRGLSVILVAANPQIGATYRLPAPFITLRAPLESLQNQQLPAFLLVDRAGWIRQSEILPATDADPPSARLKSLLLAASDPTPALIVGQLAPDFSVRDASGNWRRISALRGRKNLLLTFFPKCFTGHCRTHLSGLRDEFAAFETRDTEIWAVSVDPAEGKSGQLAFARDLGLPFPLLPDVGRQISLLYGATPTPFDLAARQSVLIDKSGVVRLIDRQLNPATHAQDLLVILEKFRLKP